MALDGFQTSQLFFFVVLFRHVWEYTPLPPGEG